MIETQQQDIGQQLQEAVLRAAMPAEADSTPGASETPQRPEKPWNPRDGKPRPKGTAVSPKNGQPVPAGPGRAPGTKNRLTNLREAVLEAFDQVGGAQYLAKLAEGTSSDRAAFVGLVSKVLPTQINANVEGGVQVQLSWLGTRQIGTTVAQPADVVTQVVDLQRDSSGAYRIIDPVPAAAGSPAAAGTAGQEPVGDANAP
jgi:hypothetical protein